MKRRLENNITSALLIGTYEDLVHKHHCMEYIQELGNLATTYGLTPKVTCPVLLKSKDPSLYLHTGKVEEIKKLIIEHEIHIIIIDEEISPSQQRNLEKAWKLPVMDRTGLILEIFAQRAHSREAQLQIELAHLEYSYPRLTHLWSHFSRQRASGGYLKGEGEKQIEVDRRLIQKRKQHLRKELKEVEQHRIVQKEKRLASHIPSFAIIGYTNAGKSSLLHALTDAQILIEDKLFATLDPMTKSYRLPNHQQIVLTDTVGFIRKLPHILIEAFKSTLESALYDDVLLHIIDVSHPMAEEHAETTINLLHELKVVDPLMITVLNKIDLCHDPHIIAKMRLRYPRVVEISAMQGVGFQELLQAMMEVIASTRMKVILKIPQAEYASLAFIYEQGMVLTKYYEDNDIFIEAEVPKRYMAFLSPFLYKTEAPLNDPSS